MSDTLHIQNIEQAEGLSPQLSDNLTSPTRLPLIRDFSEEQYSPDSHINLIRQDTPDDKLLGSAHSSVNTLKPSSKKRISLNVHSGSPANNPRRASRFKEGSESPRRSPALLKQASIAKSRLRASPSIREKPGRRTLRPRSTKELSVASGSYSQMEELQNLYHQETNDNNDSASNTLADMSPRSDYGKKISMKSRIKQMYYQMLRKKLARSGTQAYTGTDTTEFLSQVQEIKDNVRTPNDERIRDLVIVDKNPVEKLGAYYDNYPLLKFRKAIMRIQRIISFIAFKIIKHPIFEYFILAVIITNSVILAMDDPTSSGLSLPGADNVLLGLYTAECVLKILGMGFFFNEGAYLRDLWNILDFVIVVTGYIPLIFTSDGLNLQAFRALRVLRPLKTISKIEELRVLIGTLISAFGPLLETLLILVFVYLIFAIAGLQLFTGQLLYRCFYLETGVPVKDDTEESTNYQMFCIDSTSCPADAICGKMINNPNWDITNFDTLQNSFLMVFQIVTQEGWSDIMYFMEKSFTRYSAIYFIALVVICAFFLLNLTLAVLTVKFTENSEREVKDKDPNEKYWIHGEKYFDKLEYNKREVLSLMEKRRNGEIEFNKYEMKKDNLIAVDANKAHKFKAGVSRKKRRVNSNGALGWLQQSVEKITRHIPVKQSFTALVSMVKRTISTKRSSSITPADGDFVKSQSIKKIELTGTPTPKILITTKTKSLKGSETKSEPNAQFATENVNTERPDLNSTTKPLLSTNSPPFSAKLPKDSNSQVKPMDSSRLIPTLTPEKSPKKADDSPHQHQPNGTPSLVIIPSIAEANEKSEHSLSGVTSKNFLPIQRNNFMSSSLKASSPIRPLLAEKVQVKANSGEKASLINIAGIRNKDDQNQKVQALEKLAKRTYVFDATPVPESKEFSFNDEQSVFDTLDPKSPIGQMANPKTIKYQNKILNKINQINNPKNIKPRKSRLSAQQRLSAMTSTFDLGEGAVVDHEVDGFVPTGILDDSDFLDEDQRRELIRRKKQEKAIRRKLNGGRSPTKRTTRNMITSFGHLPKGESHTHVGSRKFVRGSVEGDRSSLMNKIYEEDDDDERFVIDVRYLKAIPAFERDYDATCENDVLPSKKEREERAQEEMEIESLKKARLKLEFKITPLDEKRAKDRMESYYSRSSDYASIIGASQRSRRAKTLESMIDAHESKSVHEKDFETNNSRQVLQRQASKLTKKKTYNPSSYHMSGAGSKKSATSHGRNAANKNNDDDYIKPEKMNDFVEILNRIEKPFENETGLDNPQVQDEKLKEFKFQEEYRAIRKTDLDTFKIGEKNWSGDNVLPYTNANFAVNRVKLALNKQDFDIWRPGYAGVFHGFRRVCRALIESSLFNNFIMVSVFLNTLLLATQGLVSDSATALLNDFNLTFTIVFTIELVIKVIGLGIPGYVSDNMNIFDAAIVAISLFEIIFLSGSKAVSALRSIRLLRTFRVLRVTKLLRSLKYMQIIISVLSRSLKKFFYIFVLLFLFLFIYTLLGMQLFGGGLDLPDNVGSTRVRQNFDSFLNAFMSAFQVMTQENWTDIAFLSVRSKYVNTFISLLYFISWIWIGNYILLNLFLAILLDEFTSDDSTDEYEELELEDDGSGTFSSRGNTFERSSTTKHGTGTQRSLSKDSGGHKSITSNSKADADFGDDDEGARQIKNQKTEILLCEKSLYYFTKQNPIRKICLRIIQHRYFERMIMTMIVFSSVKLAFDSYYDGTDSPVLTISNRIDYGINVFFALEATLKVISLGLFVDEGCYLRDTWNQLDAIIVIASLLDMSISSVNLGFIKILRLLRTLRPLRFITHNKNMRIIVTALLESVSAIFNVLIVTLLIWIMFAILAINIWQGKLWYCNLPNNNSYYYINVNNCASDYGGVWTNQLPNYDNIFQGLMALFIMSTQENWPNIMFMFEDANDPTTGPIDDNMRVYADLYSCVGIFVVSYFLVNLFIGVIFLEFARAQKREDHLKKFLTPEQQNWVIIQRLLIAIKPDLSNVEPKGKFTKKVFRIINHTRFELFIMTIIILNIVVMGLSYEESSTGYTDVLNYVNWGFSGVFLGEMILKHIGYGVRRYWASSWNKFDAFVVAASIFDILTTLLQQSFFSFIRFGPQLARIFRVLRVSRLFKLVKSFQGLQKMLQTLVFTLPSLLNVGALLFLVYYIYAVLATYIFSNIDGGQIIDSQYVHFRDFFTAIITLFRCSTGENWYIIMYDTITPTSCLPGTWPCGTWAAYPFWLSFFFVCVYIFINLFVLIIMQQFEEYHLNEDNPMNTFLMVMDHNIVPAWEEFALKYGGTHIHISQLTDFFSRIPAPYGFKGSSLTKIEMSKALMQLDIPTDFDNMFYYNDIIFAVFRFGFQNKQIEDPNEKQSQYLNMHEEKTITKLNALKKNAMIPGLRRRTTVREQTKIKKGAAGANPIIRILFMGMTMKAWTNYTHAVIEKMEAAKENGVEYVESESEEDDYTFIDPDASESSESPKGSSLNIKEEEGESDNDEGIDTEEEESLVELENNERKSKQDGDEENPTPYNVANMALRNKFQRGQRNQGGTKITITTHSSIKGASHFEIDKKASAPVLTPQKLVKFVEANDALDLPAQGYSFLDQEFSPKKFDSKKGSKSNVEDGEKPSVINVNIQNNVIINNNYFVNATPTSENGELGSFSPVAANVTVERNVNVNRVQSQQQPGRFARRPLSGSRKELSLNDTLTVPQSKGTPMSKKSDESM